MLEKALKQRLETLINKITSPEYKKNRVKSNKKQLSPDNIDDKRSPVSFDEIIAEVKKEIKTHKRKTIFRRLVSSIKEGGIKIRFIFDKITHRLNDEIKFSKNIERALKAIEEKEELEKYLKIRLKETELKYREAIRSAIKSIVEKNSSLSQSRLRRRLKTTKVIENLLESITQQLTAQLKIDKSEITKNYPKNFQKIISEKLEEKIDQLAISEKERLSIIIESELEEIQQLEIKIIEKESSLEKISARKTKLLPHLEEKKTELDRKIKALESKKSQMTESKDEKEMTKEQLEESIKMMKIGAKENENLYEYRLLFKADNNEELKTIFKNLIPFSLLLEKYETKMQQQKLAQTEGISYVRSQKPEYPSQKQLVQSVNNLEVLTADRDKIRKTPNLPKIEKYKKPTTQFKPRHDGLKQIKQNSSQIDLNV